MPQNASQVCQLSHPGFRMLGEPVFRLSEGNAVPSMVIPFDGHDAVLPLRSLAREFQLGQDSPDARMLHLIEQALDFVVAVRLGDTLPPELFGQASWEPTDQDRRIASSRMWKSLVHGTQPQSGTTTKIEGGTEPGWESLPQNHQLIRDAISAATQLLGNREDIDIRECVATVIAELSYIETMRRILGRNLQVMRERLVGRSIPELPSVRRDTYRQVQALARRGVGEITRRFDDIDASLDNVLALLRDTPGTVATLRRKRDWLFRTNHAWNPVFNDWSSAPVQYDEFLWKTVERTYQFLAPRYMPFHEWSVTGGTVKQEGTHQKVW
jgi:hypothetical protein